jgi:hypothetical protein
MFADSALQTIAFLALAAESALDKRIIQSSDTILREKSARGKGEALGDVLLSSPLHAAVTVFLYSPS